MKLEELLVGQLLLVGVAPPLLLQGLQEGEGDASRQLVGLRGADEEILVLDVVAYLIVVGLGVGAEALAMIDEEIDRADDTSHDAIEHRSS